jgi:DNA primase
MSIFDTLREQIPLERVIQANGHGKVRCIAPDHEDPRPSMHVYDDHVYCYGCGFCGDVTDVWGVIRGIGQPLEAALDLARELKVELPEMRPEARQKSEERREKERECLRLAQACHAALEQHHSVRDWWEDRGFGDELRRRFLLGSNRDGTEAVIPFWHRGRALFLIRRKLRGEPKYLLPPAEELPDGYKPLFVPNRLGHEVFLVEGYIDALAVAAAGRSAVALGGTHFSDEQRAEMNRLLPEGGCLYCLTDDDDSGAEAARSWGREFFPTAMICSASYGEGAKDIADTFAREGSEKTGQHLDRLASGAQDMIDVEMEVAATLEGGVRERLACASENIVPLLARITREALQDATADIVAEKVKLKKSWLNKAIKEERERLYGKSMESLAQMAQEEKERRRQEHLEKVAEAQDEIDTLLANPGVLGRLRDAAARMHNVHGDRESLELALLVALGAQLEPLPNGRPLGASILLTAEAGRGKNHIVDAAVKPLPEEFYFAFEIASGQSLYYKADEDPEFLKHTFAYPNEIEGAEQLWEFLRPMLSKGRAKKIVTAKDADGNMTTNTIIVEGPVTIAIPTIRNKTDEQLQTRLLVAELPDYPGRVKNHSAAVSTQLLPDAAIADHSRERWLWQEGLRQLTTHRRVVFPLRHPDFALDDDQVSHGARLWANLLSMMCTHAWLEQRNRRLLDLSAGDDGDEGRVAVEATPDDYAAAYRIFVKVCKRTVVNLSETHRRILGALYDLHEEFPNREGFAQREIAKGAEVSLSTVSDNKTFLVTSAKFIKETDAGLALVEGAHPSWWATGDLMTGLPTPEQVRSWWEDRNPPPKGAEHAEHAEHAAEQGQNPHTYARNVVRHQTEQAPNTFECLMENAEQGAEPAEHVRQVFGNEPNSENGLSKRNTADEEEAFGVFGSSGDDEDASTLSSGSGDSEEDEDVEEGSIYPRFKDMDDVARYFEQRHSHYKPSSYKPTALDEADLQDETDQGLDF